MDKTQDIGMIYTQHGHVCAPSESSLVDGLCGLIKDPDEGNGPACQTTGCAYAVVFWSNSREGETRASTAFVDYRSLFYRFENILNRIFYRKYKTPT